MWSRRKDVEVRAEVVNHRAASVRFTLEPWGMPCELPARTRFTLIGSGPVDEPFEIAVAENGDVTAYAPSAALVRVYGPGGEVSRGWSCTDHRPPGLPSGVSMRRFLTGLFS